MLKGHTENWKGPAKPASDKKTGDKHVQGFTEISAYKLIYHKCKYPDRE